LAAVIERLSDDYRLLAQTKTHALEAARERWNWENESQALVISVGQVI
jgi:hypothetical protein